MLLISYVEVQTKQCNYSLVYLLVTYVLKDKPSIKTLLLSPWISGQLKTHRLRL